MQTPNDGFHTPTHEVEYPPSATAAKRSPSPPPGDAALNATAQKRRPKFTLRDDLIISREFAATRAIISEYGAVQKNFNDTAEKSNENKQLSTRVSGKILQDRYKKIQSMHKKGEAKSNIMSEVFEKHIGGEAGDLYEFLAEKEDARHEVHD